MSLLVDTHVLLWFVVGDRRLGASVRAAVAEGVVVSAITAWEISIKAALGRLNAADEVEALLAEADVPELDFTARHGREAGRLPMHHRDPFDRALIAQARVEGLVLVTADPAVQRYDVALLDATR